MRRTDLGARRELPADRHRTHAEREAEYLGVLLGGRFDVEHDDGCPRPYAEPRWLAHMPPTDAGVLRDLAELECVVCHCKRRLVYYNSPDISPTDVEAAEAPQQARAGGAPRGTGLTWEAIVDSATALWPPDGPEPTAEAVSESLGVSDRYVRTKTSPHGGWPSVLEAMRASR